MEGYSSGQRGQTVNLLAKPSEVRILPPPPFYGVQAPGIDLAFGPGFGRKAGVVQR